MKVRGARIPAPLLRGEASGRGLSGGAPLDRGAAGSEPSAAVGSKPSA
jgi:hypothetical protein